MNQQLNHTQCQEPVWKPETVNDQAIEMIDDNENGPELFWYGLSKAET